MTSHGWAIACKVKLLRARLETQPVLVRKGQAEEVKRLLDELDKLATEARGR